jgi:Uma2 family endonuclease
MGMHALPTTGWTVEMLETLPNDGKRYEIIDGELFVTPARVDRGPKRLLYQREGVPEYLIVDVDSGLVERWRPRDERPEILTEGLEWRPSGLVEPLIIDRPELFAEVE